MLNPLVDETSRANRLQERLLTSFLAGDIRTIVQERYESVKQHLQAESGDGPANDVGRTQKSNSELD